MQNNQNSYVMLASNAFHPSSSPQAAPQGAVDLYMTRVLGRFHGILLETYMLLATVADGNCAYRAVSLAMFGTEDQHTYVRLMASIEMLENRASTMTSSHCPSAYKTTESQSRSTPSS